MRIKYPWNQSGKILSTLPAKCTVFTFVDELFWIKSRFFNLLFLFSIKQFLIFFPSTVSLEWKRCCYTTAENVVLPVSADFVDLRDQLLSMIYLIYGVRSSEMLRMLLDSVTLRSLNSYARLPCPPTRRKIFLVAWSLVKHFCDRKRMHYPIRCGLIVTTHPLFLLFPFPII